jgi:aminoglycoside phosphotransferase family enzyme
LGGWGDYGSAHGCLDAGKLLDVQLEALHEHVKQFHSKAQRLFVQGRPLQLTPRARPAGAHAKVRGRVVGEEAVQQLRYSLEHYSR